MTSYDAALASLQAAGRLPSIAAAVALGGTPAWQGSLSVLPEPEVTVASAYRIGSITKTLTAVLVLQLRDAGIQVVTVGRAKDPESTYALARQVATALGVLVGLNPWLGLGCLATWLAMAKLFRISSLSALVTAVLAPVYTFLLMGWGKTAVAVLALALLLVYRHKSNLIKLVNGEEGRIGRTP